MLIFFVLPITMKAKYWAWLTVALVGYGCLVTTKGSVADLAHLGGVVVGISLREMDGYGAMPSWMAAIQRALPGGIGPKAEPRDEFHSSRPGVAYNHPYRTFDEEETGGVRPAKSVLRRILPAGSKNADPEELDKEEYIRKEIDPILDKIAKQGMQSLSRANEDSGRREGQN